MVILIEPLGRAEKVELLERCVVFAVGAIGVVNVPFRAALLLAIIESRCGELNVRREHRLEGNATLAHDWRASGVFENGSRAGGFSFRRGSGRFDGVNHLTQFLRALKSRAFVNDVKLRPLLRRVRAVYDNYKRCACAIELCKQRRISVVHYEIRSHFLYELRGLLRVSRFDVHGDDAHRNVIRIAVPRFVKLVNTWLDFR